jgi:hypothetical protein
LARSEQSSEISPIRRGRLARSSCPRQTSPRATGGPATSGGRETRRLAACEVTASGAVCLPTAIQAVPLRHGQQPELDDLYAHPPSRPS